MKKSAQELLPNLLMEDCEDEAEVKELDEEPPATSLQTPLLLLWLSVLLHWLYRRKKEAEKEEKLIIHKDNSYIFHTIIR